MTWFGKILTFVVLVASVVWAFFTIQSFVNRTNWHTRAAALEVALKETRAAREAEYKRNQASEAALKSLLATEQDKTKNLATQVEKFAKDAASDADSARRTQIVLTKGDADNTIIAANVARALVELDISRKRQDQLENEAQGLVLAAESAKKEEVKAKNAARLALAIADDNAKKVEELVLRVNELKNSGGSATNQVIRSITKPPPPVLANLRGEVQDVAGELLTVSIGIDAGLAVGTVLDVIRLEGGGKYLGSVKVTSALNLFPKQAIVTFTPARSDIPLDRLAVGDLPKRGDLVRPPEALTGNR